MVARPQRPPGVGPDRRQPVVDLVRAPVRGERMKHHLHRQRALHHHLAAARAQRDRGAQDLAGGWLLRRPRGQALGAAPSPAAKSSIAWPQTTLPGSLSAGPCRLSFRSSTIQASWDSRSRTSSRLVTVPPSGAASAASSRSTSRSSRRASWMATRTGWIPQRQSPLVAARASAGDASGPAASRSEPRPPRHPRSAARDTGDTARRPARTDPAGPPPGSRGTISRRLSCWPRSASIRSRSFAKATLAGSATACVTEATRPGAPLGRRLGRWVAGGHDVGHAPGHVAVGWRAVDRPQHGREGRVVPEAAVDRKAAGLRARPRIERLAAARLEHAVHARCGGEPAGIVAQRVGGPVERQRAGTERRSGTTRWSAPREPAAPGRPHRPGRAVRERAGKGQVPRAGRTRHLRHGRDQLPTQAQLVAARSLDVAKAHRQAVIASRHLVHAERVAVRVGRRHGQPDAPGGLLAEIGFRVLQLGEHLGAAAEQDLVVERGARLALLGQQVLIDPISRQCCGSRWRRRIRATFRWPPRRPAAPR